MDMNQAAFAALYTAVNLAYQQGRATYTPLWEKVATRVASTSAANRYDWIGDFSRLREWLGERQINRMKLHGYTLANRKFEGTEGIPVEYVEDDSYGLLMPKFQDMGYAAATHPDELVFEVLAKGFDQPCYDGQAFFDTDHPVGLPGQEVSVSNMQAGSGAPWFLMDTRRPLKPLVFQPRRDYRLLVKNMPENSDFVFMNDEILYGVDARCNAGYGFWQMAFASKADLNDDNFDAAWSAMGSHTSDHGRPLGITPNILVCGPSNRARAKKVVEAENKAQGESNTNYKAVEVLVVPWLA